VSSPSHPPASGEPDEAAQPSTAEIPVVQPAAVPVTKQLPPHPGATSFGAQPAPTVAAPQPTGPVDFVPGLPGLGTPPPPPPATGAHAAQPAHTAPTAHGASPAHAAPAAEAAQTTTWPESLETAERGRPRTGARAVRVPKDRSTLAAIGLAALALILLELGLVLDLGAESLWEVLPLWSAFATAAAVVGLGAVLLSSSGGRARADLAWRVGAAGLVGLAVFWLLVVLPNADTDRGFLLTAALLSLGAALWVAAKRD
jgi:hypothetical protein